APGVEERLGDELSARLEETARQIEDRVARRLPDLSGIAAEVASLTARLAELEERPLAADPSERVAELERRIAAFDGVEQRLADELRGELESRLAEVEPQTTPDPRIDAVEQRLVSLDEVRQRLAELEQRPAADDRVDAVEQRLASVEEIRERLAELEQRPVADERVDQLEQRLASLDDIRGRLA